MSFHCNIDKIVEENEFFRKVIFTGAKSQLVMMSIPPGEEVGTETHDHVEQTLYFHSGSGVAVLNGKEYQVNPGDAVIVTPGTQHNFINTGTVPLKIATVYAPANHLDGRIHKTKAEADADQEDEDFGHHAA